MLHMNGNEYIQEYVCLICNHAIYSSHTKKMMVFVRMPVLLRIIMFIIKNIRHSQEVQYDTL